VRNRVASILVVLIASAVPDARGQDSTADLIRGIRVDNLVKVRRTSDDTREQTKANFQFSLRDGHRESLVAGMTMTATREVRFAYIDFNPLAVAIVGAETSVPDPNYQQLTEFVDALLKIPGLIKGGESGGLEACKPLQTVDQYFKDLQKHLNASDGLPETFNTWKDTIGKAPGPASIGAVQTLMSANAKTIATSAQEASSILKSLEEFTKRTSDNTTEKPTEACVDAQRLLRTLALAALSNPSYRERIDGLTQLASALKDLADSLDRYTTGEWEGTSYVFFTTTPSAELKKTITLKATPLTFRFTATTLTRVQADAKAVSTSFVLREYQSLIPELAAGFVVAIVRAPQYGTGTDAAGKTIVVRQKDKPVSFSGALLLNWVSARPAHSSLQPLFQTGVSLSPDGPGLLFGLGARIGRPKLVAFSAGGILAWVKDLNALSVGGPVSGTAELKDDLSYKPTVKAYFALQYQFRDPK
jgi:hypothetical protein